MPHPSSQRFPSHIPWHAGFCVARTDEQSMICYRNEQSANRAGSHLPRIRLDGGFRSFWKHWRSNVSYSQPCCSFDSRGECMKFA
uniref:Uncharacterized protein n=1 Tax=Parascaris equorum TaxID=6256 RepID=A0A914R914_PAREQ